ncbi:MAG: SRPBCC family protein [Flavobacteriaceae bacterium]
MEINSSFATVNQPLEAVFSRLSTPESFGVLMPEGASFSVGENDSFRFKLGSMPELSLRIKERISPGTIILESSGGKVAFELIGQLEALEENQTQVQLQFKGDLNPMMAMMVKKPLTQFLEALIGNMDKL